MRDSDVRRLLRGDDEGVGASLSGSAETSTVTSSENIISAASQASLSNALALKENADTHAKVRRCRDVSHRLAHGDGHGVHDQGPDDVSNAEATGTGV